MSVHSSIPYDSAAHRGCDAGVDPARAGKKIEQLLVGLRFPQAVIADDVGGNVLARLNGDLKRVLHEAALHQIGFDDVRPCETRELGDARFYEGELLRDEMSLSMALAGCRSIAEIDASLIA